MNEVESVWDYPRPPAIEPCELTVRVEFAGAVIAESDRAWRVCETSHPPVYYIPRDDVDMSRLRPSPRRTCCEFKGIANYWTLDHNGRISPDAAWSYEEPSAAFQAIRGCLAFYAHRVDACSVGGEQVRPQPGSFYGGWITSWVRGPFKGAPGTEGW
ncbi:MAG: DUF427 domain-containing protein [Bryobacterales bacterium]|nr:DUF427 domain-containing protein [Bryobacterales bacterium]